MNTLSDDEKHTKKRMQIKGHDRRKKNRSGRRAGVLIVLSGPGKANLKTLALAQ
jgi:hypothetical protein